MIKKILFPILFLSTISSFAQTPQALPIAVNLQQTYTKGTRTLNGAPGKKYWQNKADYRIKISFDPKSRNLAGTVGIDYTNNSPDTLKEIYFKLYPNLYKKGAVRNMVVEDADVTDGVQVQQLSIDQKSQDEIGRAS